MRDLGIRPRLESAVSRGREFLRGRQRKDGTLLDYDLAPGAGVAWPTALAGLALGPAREFRGARQAARTALEALRRPQGWGYNDRTACDADSTAWVVRFLATSGGAGNGDPAVLERYLDDQGHAHTFIGEDRFGTWAAAHPDVTPVVGLALAEGGGSGAVISRVRRAVLATWQAGCGWPCFWWTSAAYASARSLEFLAATGGVPGDLAAAEMDHLAGMGPVATVFDAANRLAAAAVLGVEVAPWAGATARELAATQLEDGSWPPSSTLRVPDQRAASTGEVHPDVNRVVGTAHAVMALARFLENDRS